MIRLSVELPEIFRYRLKPLIDLRQKFYDNGVWVGWNLPNPDLRIVNQDMAIEEIESSPAGRLRTPTIVDERVDGAQVKSSLRVRSAMAHPDVKLWLKRSTFRDYRFNNGDFLAGGYHYRLLNEIPAFHVDEALQPCVMPLTADMAGKIRLLPTACVDRFSFVRDQQIKWQERRPIDVSFADMVDYGIHDSDFRDQGFAGPQTAASSANETLVDHHRRGAIQQLARLRYLRVLIATNWALQAHLYGETLMRSSISVSPWGFGECAYRDYESMLAGCVLVKPDTDYVRTFAPDIYQSGKYYVACRPDFSDLGERIEEIMSSRAAAVDLACRARDAVLAANSPDRIYAHFAKLIGEALGSDIAGEARWAPPKLSLVLALNEGALGVTRADAAFHPIAVPAIEVEKCIVLTEDCSPNASHDLRLLSTGPVTGGLYRLHVAVRSRGRSSVLVQLHRDWQEALALSIDLNTASLGPLQTVGNLFKLAYRPEIFRVDDGWLSVVLVIEITDFVDSGLSLVLYAATQGGSIYYDGDGRVAVDIAALELRRIDLGIHPMPVS